jgi:hypothetical protein
MYETNPCDFRTVQASPTAKSLSLNGGSGGSAGVGGFHGFAQHGPLSKVSCSEGYKLRTIFICVESLGTSEPAMPFPSS